MKTNSKDRKPLLVLVALVLVAAISVGITLAYLTATTNEKINAFKASPGISGLIKEPNFDLTKNHLTIPGVQEAKDPLVQNTSPDDAEIIVGAKLSYYIDIGSGYQQVTKSVFDSFVTIKYNTTTGFNSSAYDASKYNASDNHKDTNFNAGAKGSGDTWFDVTTLGDDNTKYSYFIYSRVLEKIDTQIADNDTTYTGNTYKDNTAPIFTSVTPNKDIKIVPGYTGTYTSTINTLSASNVYEKFNYQIKIDSYGVKNDGTITGDVDDGYDEKIYVLRDTIIDGLEAM